MVNWPRACSSPHRPPVRPERGCASAGFAALLVLGTLHPSGSQGTQLQKPEDTAGPARCLASGDGYLRARLGGSIDMDIDWGNEGTECTGMARPSADGGIRLRFGRPAFADGSRLVLVFGMSGLREGQDARALPVNVTVIREGSGEFYGTQGENRCLIDELRQRPIAGIPRRQRAYRVTARGFCMQPARAVRGEGSVLITRFDYAGQVNFSELDQDVRADAVSSHP